MIRIRPNDSFVRLLVVCDGLCQKLFVFLVCYHKLLCVHVRSWELLCVPVRLLCIRIVLHRTLLANSVQSCAFDIASNQPSLEICQSRAFSMARIGLFWKFTFPVSMLCSKFLRLYWAFVIA